MAYFSNGTKLNHEQIEALHPGFKVIAGPLKVNADLPRIAMQQKAAAVRAYRDQLKADPSAKIILAGHFAYVLRSSAGWQKQRTQAGKFKENAVIRAGRGMKLS